MVALKEWIENPIDVSFSGIYDNSQGLCHYEFMMKHDKLQTIINNAKQNQYDPMVWLININKKTPVYKNALPIHRKIYDVANMMVYKKHLYIMSLNPRAELVRVKTDLLGYINIDNEIPIDYHTWGVLSVNGCPLNRPKYMTHLNI